MHDSTNIYAQGKRIDKLRIKAIASALAAATVWKELSNPSEIADCIMDYDPDHDHNPVYRELERIYDKMQKDMLKATTKYLESKR